MNLKKRLYRATDAAMLETARTLHSHFLEEIADFTAFDNQLNITFANNWLHLIKIGDSAGGDRRVVVIQRQKTERVKDIMDLCRQKYMELKYFAAKAFPNNHAILVAFGLHSYAKVSNKQHHMVNFMNDIHKTAQKHSIALLAAGLTQAQIDETLNLHTQLLNANTEQENYMRNRAGITQKRIISLNNCYIKTMLVVNASKQVYVNDYARYHMFKIDLQKHRRTDTEVDEPILDED